MRLLAGLQLVHAFADCRLADLGRPCDRPDTAMPQDPGLGSQQQTPLPLIQVWKQHPELCELTTDPIGDAHITTTSRITRSNTLILWEPLAYACHCNTERPGA